MNYQLILASDLIYFLIDAFKSCTDGYTLGGFGFIPSKHPDFYASHSERLNGRRNLILQLILDPGDPNQVHVVFQF